MRRSKQLEGVLSTLASATPEAAEELRTARDQLYAVGVAAENEEYTVDRLTALADAVRLLDEILDAPEQHASESLGRVRRMVEEFLDPGEATTDTVASADAEMLPEFATESLELLELAEEALLVLEADPADSEALNTVFRSFHTIKGSAGFLGLERLSEFAHAAETHLSRMRDGEIRCSGRHADLALRSIDGLKASIAAIATAKAGSKISLSPALDSVMAALDDRGEQDETPTDGGDGPAPSIAPSTKRLGTRTDTSVRVRTERLDRLIDMVGELVIAQSMVSQDSTKLTSKDDHVEKNIARSAKIVRELHDLSMSLRMVPLRSTFRTMTRVARDVAQKRGKRAELVLEGEETEIDRNMVDVISDALVHMVRNAVDHGIESPEDRQAAGKSPTGTVGLKAYHAGGNVVVELRDDGRGLDRDRISRKAIERGLIDSDRGMTDSEVFGLLFQPGFSTAETVTDVSGRGVGLDVVRRAVESIQGRIDISSTQGNGSTFWLKLPLTLAITDGMVVRVGSERYIVPLQSIVTSFRPTPATLPTLGGRGELVRVRDTCVPLVRLSVLFDIPDAIESASSGLVILLDDGVRRFALLVDELLAQQQVVVKSLGAGVGRVPGLSGAAILGDGHVGLILDPCEIAELSRRRSDMPGLDDLPTPASPPAIGIEANG